MIKSNYGIQLHENFDPGMLDTPATIVTNLKAGMQNDFNEDLTPSWGFSNVMCFFQYMSGKELTDQNRETTYLRAKMIIRYFPDLKERDYVQVDSKDWDIETIGRYGKDYHLLYLRYKG